MRCRGAILEKAQNSAGISLLFAAGERPSIEAIDRLLSQTAVETAPAHITHRPEVAAGWLELNVSGLTFDLIGLTPGAAMASPCPAHVYGLPSDMSGFDLEAVWLIPGIHIAAGAALLPIVKAMTGLAALLAQNLPVKAICWHPAHIWMDPGYFVRIVQSWLDGGAFPALGLMAVGPAGEGDIRSRGLAHFTGQEVTVERSPGEPVSETVKLAVRAIDHLVGQGSLRARQTLSGPDGEALLAEPVAAGALASGLPEPHPDGSASLVRVWRA